MGEVLDGHYLCIQLSRMSLYFLDDLSECWKYHFRGNGVFLQGFVKMVVKKKKCLVLKEEYYI
jgi:hypothetical protein